MDGCLCLARQGLFSRFVNPVVCCAITEPDANSLHGDEGHIRFYCHPKCLFYCSVLEQDTLSAQYVSQYFVTMCQDERIAFLKTV